MSDQLFNLSAQTKTTQLTAVKPSTLFTAQSQQDTPNRRKKTRADFEAQNTATEREQRELGIPVPNTIFTDHEYQAKRSLNYDSQNSSVQPKQVRISQLNENIQSKADLYKVLAIEGRFYLPGEDICTFKFLKQILTKQKLVFKTNEIQIAFVPYYKELSVEKVLEIAYKSELVRRYLPDQADVNAKRFKRDYLFNLLNTIDKSFFDKAVNEVEQLRADKSIKKEDQTIDIDPSMLALLSDFRARTRFKQKRNTLGLLNSTVVRKRTDKQQNKSSLSVQFAAQ